MNRRPQLPQQDLFDRLADYNDRINRLERGYHRDEGASFGVPFRLGDWLFEEVEGSMRITDIGTNSPVGITVLDSGRTIIGSGTGTGTPNPPSTLPSQGLSYPITAASTTWLAPHTLTFEPSVTCLNIARSEFWPDDVKHAPGLVIVSLLAPAMGTVVLS